MSLEKTIFIIPEEERATLIDKDIIGKLPENSRRSGKQRVMKIVNNYEFQDANALYTLARAAEVGRFDEFAEKLENFYQEELAYLSPEDRRKTFKIWLSKWACKAEGFFHECDKSLRVPIVYV